MPSSTPATATAAPATARTGDTGPFRGRIAVTTVYYAPGQQASAQLLQREFPAIERVRPRFAGLPGSGLTVVLTRDYPA